MSIQCIERKFNDANLRESYTMEYHKDVLAKVDEIVRDNIVVSCDGYEISLGTVCHDDQRRLVALMLQQSKIWGEDFEAITESREDTLVQKAFIDMLENNTTQSKVLFADTLTNCLISYYRNRLESLISERAAIVEIIEREECGLVARTDSQTGETFWARGFAL